MTKYFSTTISLLAATLSAGLLSAAEITVTGTASGYIGSPYTQGLTYMGTNFSGTTSGGVYNIPSLGSFTLPAGNYSDQFTLQISVSTPLTNPTPSYFTYTGIVSSNNGNVGFTFNNPAPQKVTYTTSYYPTVTTGNFYFGVNNISSHAGSTLTLTGFADETLPTPAPEPSNYILILAGFGLMLPLAWSRREKDDPFSTQVKA